METTAGRIGFRSLGRGTIAGLFFTLLVHGGIAAMVYVSQIKTPPREEAVRDVMVTKLVSLGKPREKFWLPRIVQPPKPKIQQPTIKVSEDVNAAAAKEPKEAPKPEDAEISKDLKRALQRAKMLAQAAQEEPPEGSLLGTATGTSNTASEGDVYDTQIYEAIKSNWSTPAGLLNDAQLAGLQVEIKIRIGEDGAILESSVLRSSSNDIFDDSCLRAIKATGKVPAPPPDRRARARKGYRIEFAGKDMVH